MRLHTLAGSRYGSRCAIQIAAKGLPIAIEHVPYPIPASFAAINPLMLVPALDTGTEIFAEAAVICEYLEDIVPEPSLRPEDSAARARMRYLIRLFEIHFDPFLLRLYGLRLRGEREQAEIETCLAAMHQALERIAEILEGPRYALGGRLTLADCALMPPFQQTRIFLPDLGLADPVQDHPAILRWFDATREDPHVAPVLDEMVTSLTGAMARWR